MYVNRLGGCGCKKCSGLSGLGAGWASLMSSAMQSYGGGGGGMGGGSSNANTNTNTVTTSTNVQVSPQISPNFIQQQQPQNSAVNASTVASPNGPTMAPDYSNGLPYTPMTGNIPGIDNGGYGATYSPSSANGMNMNVLIYGAVGALVIAMVAKHRKGRQ